jgi:hypothetical protein
VQHTNDLNRLGLGIVDDEVGVDGPEFHRPTREVLANMANPWFVVEELYSAADFPKTLRVIVGSAFSMRKRLI